MLDGNRYRTNTLNQCKFFANYKYVWLLHANFASELSEVLMHNQKVKQNIITLD